MEEVIKRNFLGFAHRVKPIQSVFLEEGCEADDDVLKCVSELEMELIEDMISGVCAFSKQRESDTVDEEDLLSYLDAYWNLDPLLVSEDFYGVEETTEGQSIPTESHPKQTTLKTERPTTSTVKKNPVRKTRSDQTMKNKSSKLKSKINTKYQDSCSEHLSPLNMKPEDEARVEKQIEMFHSYSKVRKTPGRKSKPEASSTVETPAEARKKLAMTLLRIAGKYY